MVILTGVPTIIDKAFVALPAALATLIVKLKVPTVVGVPEITPVVALMVSPPGKAPALTDQV